MREEIAKVIGVIGRVLLHVVITIPSKVSVRCPQQAKLVEVGKLFVSSHGQHQ